MITTRKLKLAIVSENKQDAYSFIRSEVHTQYKALNIAYNHLYFEYIATEKIKHSDEEYQKHLAKYKENVKNKYEKMLAVEEQADKDKPYKEKLEKEIENYNKAKERVNKIEKDYSKKARQTYQEAVGLAKQTREVKRILSDFRKKSPTSIGEGACHQ